MKKKNNKLYTWALPTFLFFISSWFYWVVLAGTLFIINSAIILIASLVVFRLSHFRVMFHKKTIIKSFGFALLSNFICVFILVFLEITNFYPPFLYGVNPAWIAIIVTFLFDVGMNIVFTFDGIGISGFALIIISVSLGIVNVPYVYLLPSEVVSNINNLDAITRFADLIKAMTLCIFPWSLL